MNRKVNGRNVNYIDTGKGDILVLLHGWGCQIEIFQYMIQVLSKKFRVIAMDMPGFGKTDEPERAYRLDDYVDFLFAFLKDLKIERASLLGHSFGGRVILKAVCRKEGPTFDKLVLVDAAGIPPKRSLKTKTKIVVYKIGKLVFKIPIMPKLYPHFMDNMRRKNGSADYNNAQGVMRETFLFTIKEDLTSCLEKVTQPTLLIWGEKDTATTMREAHIMKREIKDSKLISFPKAGHFAFLEEKEKTVEAIEQFFDKKGETK